MTTKTDSTSAQAEEPDDHLDISHDNGDPNSPDDDGNDHDGDGTKSSLPMQKRRRVTRACDTCRGKKIKCDGKQPCTHCTVYSYECTYDQPSNRRRNPAPQYIEALENRLARAEALLKTVMPQADLNDPNLGNGTLPPLVQFPNQMPRKPGTGPPTAEEKDSMMESMIEDTGALDLDAEGRPDYYGSSSGRVFYERISRQVGGFGDFWSDANQTESFLRDKSRTFESPRSAESPEDPSGLPNVQDLPSKACAQALCEVALEDAMSLLRFMHQPSFWSMFHRIYDSDPRTWTSAEHKYLPVIYAAMALGTLFAKTEDSKLELEGYQNSIESGFIYFRAAIQMVDMTDIRELPHLQAVLLLTYFIQSSAKLSTCYSFVGVCLFGALRMGMHRNYPGRFNCLEDQMRKRTFWLIRKMDIYVGGILGMPILLSDQDIDQDLPADADDELILPEQILPQPEGRFPAIGAANYHNKLMAILAKIIKQVYPLQPRGKGLEHINSISYSKIVEVEKELQEWLDGLPPALQPGNPGDVRLVRLQQSLRMSFAHVQMMLYRPFLHYIVQTPKKNSVDKRFYAAAAACVSVSRNVVHIMSEMNRRHLLIGAYWFQMYSTFWAVLTLVYYSVENQDVPTAMAQEYFNDAIEGRDMLATMAKRSNAADRCNSVLQGLFAKLPARFQRGREQTATAHGQIRKRHAQSQPRKDAVENPIRTQTTAKGSNRAAGLSGYNAPQRASTMPHHGHSSSLHANNKRTTMNTVQYPHASNPVVGLTDGYGRPTHGLYTPPGSTDQLTHQSVSPDHPSSPASAHFPPTSNIGLPNQPVSFNGMQPAVPDMANVMFPSADPFVYPNQPMTTFENHFGPMENANGGFEMVNGDANSIPRGQPQTIGDWMASSQADIKPAVGPPVSGPGDLGLADWTRGAQPNGHAQQFPVQQGEQDGMNYDALFAGQENFNGMGMGWFNNNLV